MSKFSSFLKNSTMLTKILLAALLVGVLVGGYKLLRSKGIISNKDVITTTANGTKIQRDGDADLVLAYNTFPGMEGILLMNNGMKPNEDSRLFKEFGIKLQIQKMDVVSDTREGLKGGSLDLAYCTIDALPVEMSSGSALLEMGVKTILKINESRGADAIVVRPGINSVTDLRGKKVAYAQATASNTLLINVLETSGLTMNDIQASKQSDGVEAANAFKNGQCDAAVVWAPDDADCVAAIKGSKVLVSTETATQIIADGLLVTKDNLEKKRDLITKLAKAWLIGNAELNSNPASKKTANGLFAKGFDFPEDVASASADKIRFSTLADNKSFFGFDPTFTGITGEKMYGRMSVKYTEAQLANSPAAWRSVSDGSVVEALINDKDLAHDSTQSAEKKTTFTPATEEDKTKQAQGSKQVTVAFPSGSYSLTEDAKAIIDREVTSLAQSFEKARIRVEGNTDNTGNPTINKELSRKRANAVVDYLVSEYKFDRNKFIVIGNGPDKPVADNSSEEGKQKNRRTDFNFVW